MENGIVALNTRPMFTRRVKMTSPPTPSETWTFPPEDVDAAGAPEQPPASVTEVVPAFHQHGPHNCRDHHHDVGSQAFQKYLLRQNKDKSGAWDLACSKCHGRVTLSQLHDLPCGDFICHSCLNALALHVINSIEKNHLRILDARVKLQELDRYLARRPQTTMDSQKRQERKVFSRRRAEYARAITRRAGLACCGIGMGLDRFQSCLPPNLSRDLWLRSQWLHDPLRAQRACAWPDCGASMPLCCRYLVPGAGVYRYSCVACQGNSMDCARVLLAPQLRFPWLPEGQPALTPCR
ncbi:hypothetical protein BT67DRAFT_214914 [Trichocladium antarcticum]|uniref:Uncharacterized protein n=1 Tax=Trichocladium antarcticum TaxID=1450529 RepID=A0AAN6UCJ2_9PEZI|nr:hypothetical protein BT67DRAFT_214914 [Trichocladium antarcticum]